MKPSLAATFCLFASLDVGGAFAQSSPPPPLDILGVQLKMPRESAMRLLLGRQPPYVVGNTVALTVEDLGSFVWHISLSSPPDTVYNSVDSIDLDFAPPPTESTVLRIYRHLCYSCGNPRKANPDAPTVENFQRSIAEKLKAPSPTAVVAHTNQGENRIYVWSRDGKLLTSGDLSHRLRYPAACLNPPKLDSARNNVGVDFLSVVTTLEQNFENTCGTVAAVSWTQEGGIITQFEMTFNDVAGLLLAFAKSGATIQAKNQIQHQQQLQRANQNSPKL